MCDSDSNGPDFEAMANTPPPPLLNEIGKLPPEDMHGILLVVGWKLGVVTLEDCEMHLIELHGRSTAEKLQAALRLYERLLQRYHSLLEHVAVNYG